MLKSINRSKNLKWLIAPLSALLLLLAGCGGGANDERTVVRLSATMDGGTVGGAGNYIEVEMMKSVEGTTGVVTATISAGTNTGNYQRSVATIVVDRYEMTFERIDGGSPNLPTSSGPMGITVGFFDSLPESAEFEIPIVTTFEKVYGQFGQAFRQNPSPVEFRVNLKLFAHNLAGDAITTTTGFTILCGVFNPVDELIPSIVSFNYLDSVPLNRDWLATWTTAGVVNSGTLVTPFGDAVNLDGFNFPVGTFRQNTSFLAPLFDETTASVTFPPALLTIGNFFGSTFSTGDPEEVVVFDSQAPSDDPVEITEFFANRYSLFAGDSTTLTWVVANQPSSLGILPEAFSGVPVDFSDKDLSFDSVSVVPDATVRPILKASKTFNGSSDTQFLDQEITVTGGGGPAPPEIVFFTVSHSAVPRFQQVAFFWKVTGDYEKIELLPINGQARDVTGRESFLSPPLNRLGANSFSLVVTGVGGAPIVTATVVVNVQDEEINEPVVITIGDIAPGTSIDNGDDGAFSFSIDDPENRDSSWTVFLVAGDSAVYGPSFGLIPTGHGDATVTFKDGSGSANGFLTFEISGYDDDDFGFSGEGNRTVELLTFNTTGRTSDNAPTITNVTFTPGNVGGGLLPGQDGVLSFTVFDPDTDNLRWEVEIIAGDFGGTLDGGVNFTQGNITNGRGELAVHYQDDPDSTDDAVVFLIKATELFVGSPQSTSVVFRVEYLLDTDGTITFAHNGLYNNGGGIVDPTQRIAFYLNYTGTLSTVAGAFFVDHDLTIPAPILSAVMDIQHGTGDPGRIADVDFNRDFIVPINDNENFGEFLFAGYFDFPGEDTSAGAEPSPPTDGVSRWYFAFDVESFRADASPSYNLPIVDGTRRNYFVNVMAFDEDNTEEDLQLLVTVESVNP